MSSRLKRGAHSFVFSRYLKDRIRDHGIALDFGRTWWGRFLNGYDQNSATPDPLCYLRRILFPALLDALHHVRIEFLERLRSEDPAPNLVQSDRQIVVLVRSRFDENGTTTNPQKFFRHPEVSAEPIHPAQSLSEVIKPVCLLDAHVTEHLIRDNWARPQERGGATLGDPKEALFEPMKAPLGEVAKDVRV